MFFERVKTRGIVQFAYLIGSKGEGTVVDPRRNVEDYLRLARKHKLTIKYAIETHRQQDFVMGSAELARQWRQGDERASQGLRPWQHPAG